jgi:hypothetical protein
MRSYGGWVRRREGRERVRKRKEGMELRSVVGKEIVG